MRRRYSTGTRNTLKIEMEYYDRIGGHYEPLTESDYDSILVQVPEETSAKRVLEVGCGSGAFGERLERRLKSKLNIGLDISFSLLSHHLFTPVLGNGQMLPFKDQSFDLIAACAALHHIHNIMLTMAEIYRCLAVGGRVIFIEPNADHPYRRLVVDGGFLRKYFLQTSDESIFPQDLERVMDGAGFERVSFSYLTFQNRQPSLLGRTQSLISRLPWPGSMAPFLHPWFVMVGDK